MPNLLFGLLFGLAGSSGAIAGPAHTVPVERSRTSTHSASPSLRRVTAHVVRIPLKPRPMSGGAFGPRVRVSVATKNSRGKVFCAMWRGADGYPVERKKASHDGIDRRIQNERALIEFEDVEPGEYAVACFHDENADNSLNLNFLGIPVEGTGASNDAQGFMGPPPYDDARFTVSRHGTHRVLVPIRYLF